MDERGNQKSITIPITDGLDEQVSLDLNFQQNLQFYSKEALAHLISHIAQNESTRNWALTVLNNLQDLNYTIGGWGAPAMKISVLSVISGLVDEISETEGPASLNTYSLEELTENIHTLVLEADTQAGHGNNLAALNKLLDAAARTLYGITEHLDQVPELCQQTSRKAAEPGQKETGPAATEPAVRNNHD